MSASLGLLGALFLVFPVTHPRRAHGLLFLIGRSGVAHGLGGAIGGFRGGDGGFRGGGRSGGGGATGRW